MHFFGQHAKSVSIMLWGRHFKHHQINGCSEILFLNHFILCVVHGPHPKYFRPWYVVASCLAIKLSSNINENTSVLFLVPPANCIVH